LFLNKKASSSGEIKPPMARGVAGLLHIRTIKGSFPEPGLAMKSVSFQPKPAEPEKLMKKMLTRFLKKAICYPTYLTGR